MTDGVLSGLRVVDFSSGPAGGLATTVLADFGADVIKVEPPAGDRFRSTPSSPFWLRGKRSVVLDLTTESDRGQARELVASADVVVAGGPPSRLRSFGIDQSLCDQFPGLVHCTISGWGVNGPYAELPGYEGLVAAKSGRMAAFDVQLDQGRPVYSAVQVATHGASQAAVQGIVAALLQREQTGRGAAVETSLVQALMPFDLVDLLARQIAVRDGRSFTPLRQLSPMPTLNYHPLRTSDGKWIQCGNLLEHLFYSFLDAIDLLGEFLIDEKFQGSPAVWSVEATEEARDRILIRMQERTADEWMQAFAENGNVAAEPIISAAEALSHIDLVEGQGLVEIDDASVGAVTQIAPIAELVATPASVHGGSPTIGQHTDEVLDRTGPTALPTEPAEAPGAGVAGAPGRPLEGITVVDLSTIIAAPLAMAMLADLGARVIKVEPYRWRPVSGHEHRGPHGGQDQRGQRVNLYQLEDRRGPSNLARVGGRCRCAHPQLPWRSARQARHWLRAATSDQPRSDLGGCERLRPAWARGEAAGHPPGDGRVLPAALRCKPARRSPAIVRPWPTCARTRGRSWPRTKRTLTPTPAWLRRRRSCWRYSQRERRGGGGQMVRINMQVANAWANHDDFLAYEGKPARQSVDSGHHGLHARYRLYPTADGWVFLAATTDAEFARFCASAGCERLADAFHGR